MEIKFLKITAAGNDFIVIDNRYKLILPQHYTVVAKKLCNRKYAVGADGLILLESSNMADFKMKYLNSDGSHASMCGNGGRAIATFAYNLHIINSKKMIFETDAGLVNAEILLNDKVKLHIYNPSNIKTNMQILVEDRIFKIDFINTGVPHVVIFVKDINNIDVSKYGQLIRYHDQFKQIGGTNVNFVKVKNNNTILVRTYERGVEGETLACGTGITASGIITVLKGLTKAPINVISQGGDILIVSFNLVQGKPTNVTLEGPVSISFKGFIVI
ncbi:MAG: diaminopimelate epimerase [Endomicrobium sp.]|jgi:diaminopimelate epimerase|nr:diaminopimelate epimerase [Endomicrobium sp.]